jgi:hypothetical protein
VNALKRFVRAPLLRIAWRIRSSSISRGPHRCEPAGHRRELACGGSLNAVEAPGALFITKARLRDRGSQRRGRVERRAQGLATRRMRWLSIGSRYSTT